MGKAVGTQEVSQEKSISSVSSAVPSAPQKGGGGVSVRGSWPQSVGGSGQGDGEMTANHSSDS